MNLYKVHLNEDKVFCLTNKEQSAKYEEIKNDVKKLPTHILADNFEEAVELFKNLNSKYYSIENLEVVARYVKVLKGEKINGEVKT